jgi:transposase, IS5 family
MRGHQLPHLGSPVAPRVTSHLPDLHGGRPPYGAVLMFKVLALQILYMLSDDQTEYKLKDQLSLM